MNRRLSVYPQIRCQMLVSHRKMAGMWLVRGREMSCRAEQSGTEENSHLFFLVCVRASACVF